VSRPANEAVRILLQRFVHQFTPASYYQPHCSLRPRFFSCPQESHGEVLEKNAVGAFPVWVYWRSIFTCVSDVCKGTLKERGQVLMRNVARSLCYTGFSVLVVFVLVVAIAGGSSGAPTDGPSTPVISVSMMQTPPPTMSVGGNVSVSATVNNDAANAGVDWAATCLPNLMRSKMAANESSAVGSIRTINTAMVTYSTAYPATGFAAGLTNLGGAAATCASSTGAASTSACLIDNVLSTGTKSGYNFTATGAGGTPADVYLSGRSGGAWSVGTAFFLLRSVGCDLLQPDWRRLLERQHPALTRALARERNGAADEPACAPVYSGRHAKQFSSWPICAIRPSNVVTQWRSVHGGLCRTCC
jgi:hypothetical protein